MKHATNGGGTPRRRKKEPYQDGYNRIEDEPRRVEVYEPEDAPKRVRAKKKNGVWLNILLFVFGAAFLVSGGILVWELVISPYFADRNYDEIQSVYSDTASETSADETADNTDAENTRRVEAVRTLQTVNTDITGWLKVDGTDINFPVLTPPASDPEYYLYRNYKKEDTKYGSIFLDETSGIETDNTLLHGHSMQDGRIFWCLIDFGNVMTLQKSPVIQYDTDEEAGDWKIVSVFKTNTIISQGSPFLYAQSNFSSDEEKMQFYYEAMKRSMVNTGVDLNEDDKTIMLSTCSYEYEGFRTVVMARKVRDGESAEVDTSKFTENENALFPDVWYASGRAPDYWPGSFADALAAGMISWYSGDLYS